MSALAKKMMEKYGWKEGEGLGKGRTGTKSYVKVVRRDPGVATGLGHAADPAQGGSLASTHAVELDAIYGQLHKAKKTKKYTRSSSSDSASDDTEGDACSVESSTNSSSSSSNGKAGVKENKKGASKNAEKPSRCRRSSSIDSKSDADASTSGKRTRRETEGDVTRMTDKDLFERCGGVRLGRAGRHRFFAGKLKRLHGEQ